MIVHGASFDSATLVTNWGGRLKKIVASKGFNSRRHIPASDIASVSVITNENHKSFLATAGGAVFGTILAGPLGLLVGTLVSGNRSKHIVGITLVGGEGFIAEVNPDELRQLLGAASTAANAQREEENARIGSERFDRLAGNDAISNRPVLRRLKYIEVDRPNAPEPLADLDPVDRYQGHLRELLAQPNFGPEEAHAAKEFRRPLRLSAGQKACVHAQLFAEAIAEITADGIVDADGVLRLRNLRNALQELGWAPGD